MKGSEDIVYVGAKYLYYISKMTGAGAHQGNKKKKENNDSR